MLFVVVFLLLLSKWFAMAGLPKPMIRRIALSPEDGFPHTRTNIHSTYHSTFYLHDFTRMERKSHTKRMFVYFLTKYDIYMDMDLFSSSLLRKIERVAIVLISSPPENNITHLCSNQKRSRTPRRDTIVTAIQGL